MLMWCLITSPARRMLLMAESRLLRSTGTISARSSALFTIGIFHISRFASTDVRPGMSGTRMGGSRLDTWFDIQM